MIFQSTSNLYGCQPATRRNSMDLDFADVRTWMYVLHHGVSFYTSLYFSINLDSNNHLCITYVTQTVTLPESSEGQINSFICTV